MTRNLRRNLAATFLPGVFVAFSILVTGFSSDNSIGSGQPCCGTVVKTTPAEAGAWTPNRGHLDTAKTMLFRTLFERMKKLEGDWRGKSTKGWEDQSTVKVIAKGSAILFTSFDAHPNETMLTLVHWDLDRVLLTHYCVAGNQPRLEATSIEDDGRKVTFTFVDATNLPSRNKGHMDKLVMRFIDDSHYTSQWTWYQDGKESWMEEIHRERVK
jgi:hypothetical protein